MRTAHIHLSILASAILVSYLVINNSLVSIS